MSHLQAVSTAVMAQKYCSRYTTGDTQTQQTLMCIDTTKKLVKNMIIMAVHSPLGGPHLRNKPTTENYVRFYTKLGIYQYGRERWLRSNLTSGLSSCTQVFELA